MSDFSIINSVFGKLKADSTFMAYFGLTTASLMPDIVKKIQKEMDPDGLTTNNIPLCCIYPIPGVRSRINGCVYDGMFEVAIYSNHSSAPAKIVSSSGSITYPGTMVIGARAMDLLHYVQLSGDTFKTEFQSSFQSSSGVSGIKKYIQRYKVSEVIE